MGTTTLVGTDELRSFEEDGFFVLERAIPEEHLGILRSELDGFIADVDAEMDAAGTDVAGLNHRGKRYFIALRHRQRPRIEQFLYSDLTAEICRATLGDTAYLFWEQYVVKFAEVGMKFAWHQDSGYLLESMPGYRRPYLTLWCALDDVGEENGTVYLLPFGRAGTRDVVKHTVDPATNDLVGYTGSDPGEPIVAPAGSVAVFSTTVFHRSGPNPTGRPRRVYVAQYSAEPILNDEGKPRGFAEPFLENGRRVR